MMMKLISYLPCIVVMYTLTTIDNSHCEGGLPADMVQEMIRLLPEYKAHALVQLRNMLQKESAMAEKMRRFGRTGDRRSSFRFVQGFLGLTPHGKQMSQPAFLQAKTLKLLREQFRLSNSDVELLMELLPSPFRSQPEPFVPDSTFPVMRPDVCPYPSSVQCNHAAPYRTYDGTCNNLRQPMWGSAHIPLVRFLPSQYADAIEAPRVATRGGPLPSPRLISSTIHWDIDIPHHIHTLMLMQYGQFLDHDMSRTAITKLSMDPLGRGEDLEEVECGFDGCQVQGLENQACFPIYVPRNDTEFSGQPCMMFVRSLEVPNVECKFGPREQLNQLTSHLDASHIYGSSLKEVGGLMDPLRPDRGRLQMKAHPQPGHSDLLPQDPDFKDCKGDNNTFLCFKAGDGRVNEFMGLTSLHTVWAREHNRIEEILHQLNPHWSGPRLFEETRRIITALWQWITYNEYLPIILGPNIMKHYGLNMPIEGHWNGYHDTINPGIANVFATAAMRFGHTQIQGVMEGKDVDYATREFIPISTQFRRPQLMYRPSVGGCDALLRGMIGASAQSRDPFITKQVTRHLFADEPPAGLGEDLMSLNVQRARDHGIPGYNYWREWCGLPRARTFDDLKDDLPYAVVERFRRLYNHVDDIDIWPAGVSELSYPGSSLGPTFSCIMATQFRNLKFGDRFWFENNQHSPHAFSEAQLQAMKTVTLGKIICTNSDSISSIQPYVLVHPLSKVQENIRTQGRDQKLGEFTKFYQNMANERMPCSSLPDLDLSAWQEAAAPPRPNNFIPRPQSVHNNIPQIQRPDSTQQQFHQGPRQSAPQPQNFPLPQPAPSPSFRPPPQHVQRSQQFSTRQQFPQNFQRNSFSSVQFSNEQNSFSSRVSRP